MLGTGPIDPALKQAEDELEDFGAIVCVLHRESYLKEHGEAPMDDSLPSHGYLMTLHFIARRIAMALQSEFGEPKRI